MKRLNGNGSDYEAIVTLFHPPSRVFITDGRFLVTKVNQSVLSSASLSLSGVVISFDYF
jgi:hypothetical protein